MVAPRPLYEVLAALLDYPDSGYPGRVRVASEIVARHNPAAAAAIEALAAGLPRGRDALDEHQLDELQELYTRTFDVQAATTLGIGYVLFGDDYKRGELLVHLNREMRAAGVDCGSELPDHLPTILRLLARWDDAELARELVAEIVRPALERMLAEFEEQRAAERDRLYEKHYKTLIDVPATDRTLFSQPLRATLEILRTDFELGDWRAPEVESDFVRSLGRELELEAEEATQEEPLVQIGRSS